MSNITNKLTVGMKVVVKDWDEMVSEYDCDTHGSIKVDAIFIKSMRDLCGKTLTVKEIMPHTDRFQCEGHRYMFSRDMVYLPIPGLETGTIEHKVAAKLL